jgi:hypothetical protein
MKTLSFVLVLAASYSFADSPVDNGFRSIGVPVGDGVVRIDQSRALAGGVTPADTPGFPVTISQPGSYRLTGNLTLPDLNTTAIQIIANSVTLDLNGFSIIGPAVCPAACPPAGTGTGIEATSGVSGIPPTGPRAIRVLNGSVRGVGLFGILLRGDDSVVERVTANSNAGVGIVAGSVFQSTSTQNGCFGIIANIVRDSTSSENVGDGIILGVVGPSGGVATGNVSSQNGGFGIALQLGTATGNTVFLNTSTGISALCPSAIVGNTIVTNGPAAIKTDGDGCTVANNAARP